LQYRERRCRAMGDKKPAKKGGKKEVPVKPAPKKK
jgi:hypothetical protein